MDNITSVTTFVTTSTNAANITFSEIDESTSQTITYTAGAGALSITNNAASTTTKFNITGGGSADNITGSSGDDTITGGSGNAKVDVLKGGSGLTNLSTPLTHC